MQLKNGRRCALIGAIYDIDVFAHTVSEYETKNYVTWETRLTRLEPGDIVYLFYSNLPAESEGRILFRCEVLQSKIKLTRDEIYGNGDPTLVKSIKLCNLEAVSFADTERFCMSRLFRQFGINTTRGGIYLEDVHKALIDELEDDAQDRRPLREALNYFLRRVQAINDASFCACGKQHVTFMKPDGTKYFEIHHLVPESTKTRNHLPEGLVESINNKFQLCSTCHNEIHYGQIDNRRTLIKKLYLLNKDWYDQNLKDYSKPMDVLNWLYRIYRVEKAL